MRKHGANKQERLQYQSHAHASAKSNIVEHTTPRIAKAYGQTKASNNADSAVLGMKNKTKQLGQFAHPCKHASVLV